LSKSVIGFHFKIGKSRWTEKVIAKERKKMGRIKVEKRLGQTHSAVCCPIMKILSRKELGA